MLYNVCFSNFWWTKLAGKLLIYSTIDLIIEEICSPSLELETSEQNNSDLTFDVMLWEQLKDNNDGFYTARLLQSKDIWPAAALWDHHCFCLLERDGSMLAGPVACFGTSIKACRAWDSNTPGTWWSIWPFFLCSGFWLEYDTLG